MMARSTKRGQKFHRANLRASSMLDSHPKRMQMAHVPKETGGSSSLQDKSEAERRRRDPIGQPKEKADTPQASTLMNTSAQNGVYGKNPSFPLSILQRLSSFAACVQRRVLGALLTHRNAQDSLVDFLRRAPDPPEERTAPRSARRRGETGRSMAQTGRKVWFYRLSQIPL